MCLTLHYKDLIARRRPEHSIQSNFDGSNTFGSMKICSRQGEFEPLRVYYRARSGGINRDIFSIFPIMKVYCVFSLESPQRGDSNEYTQYTSSEYEKKNPKLSQICSYRICSEGPKNEFEPAMVNEPSVFEPFKFYCILKRHKEMIKSNKPDSLSHHTTTHHPCIY